MRAGQWPLPPKGSIAVAAVHTPPLGLRNRTGLVSAGCGDATTQRAGLAPLQLNEPSVKQQRQGRVLSPFLVF